MLDLVMVQVRWDRGGTESAGEYTFLYGKWNENHELGTGFFLHKRIISAGKRVLRRIFGVKLRNEELHTLYSSPSTIRMIKSRRMRWSRHVARMEAKRNGYRIFVGKPEGKRSLGRHVGGPFKTESIWICETRFFQSKKAVEAQRFKLSSEKVIALRTRRTFYVVYRVYRSFCRL
jgi:hypothetical protein